MDEEINNPDNYSVAKYSVEYRLSITHADGTTEHYSEEKTCAPSARACWEIPPLRAYASKQSEVQDDIDQYKAWLFKGWR